MGEEILDVDAAAFEAMGAAQRKAAVDGIMRSLKTGFVYVSSSVEESLLDEAYGVLEEFFATDEQFKNSHCVPESFGSRGYTGTLVETAAISDVPDWKEMFNWGGKGRGAPEGHPLLRDYGESYLETVYPSLNGAERVLSEFHDSLVALQRQVLRIIALGIGACEGYFDEMTLYGAHLSRAINYPPMADAPGEGFVWADEHADINLITALPRATERGLQIRTDSGWTDAAPPEGYVISNTGIMLERMTNGIVPAGWHRVVADTEQEGGRLSVVQFCHPRPSAVLAPIGSTVTEENPCRYSGVTAGDLLSEVLWQIGLTDS